MKQLLIFVALFVAFNTFSQSTPVLSSSSSEGENTMKVFLCITHNDDAVSSNMKTTLNSMSGVNTIAYCNKHAVFMVIVDKNNYQSENDFLDQVKKRSANSELLSLKSGDFNSFINACEPTDPNDSQRLKNLSKLN